jgi:hypothetical protein
MLLGAVDDGATDEDEGSEMVSLCEDMIAAFKSGDADELCECLEAFVQCCSATTVVIK